MTLGVMVNDVKCASILHHKLKQGTIVKLQRATNLPDSSQFKWFASPLCDEWSGDSLAIYENDVVEISSEGEEE